MTPMSPEPATVSSDLTLYIARHNKNTVGRLLSFITTEVCLRHGAEAAIETTTVAMD